MEVVEQEIAGQRGEKTKGSKGREAGTGRNVRRDVSHEHYMKERKME